MGGLSRKALQIKDLTSKDTISAILLDAGNLLFKQPTVSHAQELITASGLMEIYQQMAYDAVAVGPLDLAAGIDFLKKGQLVEFPWLSANLTDKNNAPLFPAFKILTRGDIKIGIIGLTGQVPGTSQEIIVADWRRVLPEPVARLAKECRMIIVLSSLSSEENAELTRQFPEIQVLITADRQLGNVGPKIDHHSLVAQTGNQGKYIGVLDLDWLPGSAWAEDQGQEHRPAAGKGNAKPSSSFSGSFVALNKILPEDREIASRIEEIKQRISTHNQKMGASEKPLSNEAFSDFAGYVRCQECHAVQTQFWNGTRHAQAYATLQRQQQNFNLDCLPCHINKNPAQEKPGADSVQALLALPPSMQSVGCEACHGAGLAHAEAPGKVKMKKEVEEKTCVACHSKERDADFDYRRKSPKVSCPAG